MFTPTPITSPSRTTAAENGSAPATAFAVARSTSDANSPGSPPSAASWAPTSSVSPSSWNRVTGTSPTPASRALSEFHGVRTGAATSAMPASASACVAAAASGTSKATRTLGVDAGAFSTSAM